MGQKVNPNGFRIGVIRDWNTRWYAPKKDFADFLVEDHKIREFVKKKYYAANISRIGIDRAAGKISVSIFTARPGMLIGKGGAGIDAIKADIASEIGKPVNVNIMEIRDPDADAQLVAENIAAQLEKRIGFRRAMKNAMSRAMRLGVRGIKIKASGRLGGAEIARSEAYHEGTIPLQTIRADIEYGFAEAATTYGRIGIKVWIYKGEILKGDAAKAAANKERYERKNDRRDNRRRRDDRNGGGDRRPRRDFNNNGDRRPRGDRPQGQNRREGGSANAASKES